jgi:uncharacterized protein YdhG (YjbR/CyaY superfamily)
VAEPGKKLVDAYLAKLAAPQRKLLASIRRLILDVAPEARETISYGMPTFVVGGARVGIAAFSKHCTFFPYGGSFLDAYADELEGFSRTKSGVHFTPEKPLPARLLRRMVRDRLKRGA